MVHTTDFYKRLLRHLGISLGLAIILGLFVGPALYFSSSCGNGYTDCVAYSPFGLLISALISPPYVGLKWLVENHHPVWIRPFQLEFVTPANPALYPTWLYYFLIVSAWAALRNAGDPVSAASSEKN